LRRYFTKEEGGYRVRAEIREMVIFSPHSVIMDPPFTKLDILSCRNLLIYLAPEMQKKLFPLFHYSLNPGGILILGNAETIGHFTGLFATVSGKSRIYQRLDSAVRPDPVEFPSSFAPGLSAASDALDARKPYSESPDPGRAVAPRRYAPPSVLVNELGNIIHISGKTGKYLEPAAGKANLNIFAMARDGLRHELASAFQKALRQTGPVTLRGLKIGTNGGSQHADLIVERLEESEPLAGLVIIVFCDIAAPPRRNLPPGRPRTTRNTRAWRNSNWNSAGTARNCATRVSKCRPHRRNSGPPTRRCSPPTRRCNPPTRNSPPRKRKCSRSTRNCKRSTPSCRAARRAFAVQQRHEEPAQQHGGGHVVPRQGAEDPAFHHAGHEDHQAHPGGCGPAHFRSRVRSALSRSCVMTPVKSCASSDPWRNRSARARAVVQRAHHALPHLDDRIDGVVISFWDISVAKELEAKLQEMQLALENRLAGKSTELDKARRN
jgi:hypothetical protein